MSQLCTAHKMNASSFAVDISHQTTFLNSAEQAKGHEGSGQSPENRLPAHAKAMHTNKRGNLTFRRKCQPLCAPALHIVGGRAVAPGGDGLGSLVDVEGCADTVAGAVAVVEAHRPQRSARQSVQRQPGGPRREHRAVQRYVPLWKHDSPFGSLAPNNLLCQSVFRRKSPPPCARVFGCE